MPAPIYRPPTVPSNTSPTLAAANLIGNPPDFLANFIAQTNVQRLKANEPGNVPGAWTKASLKNAAATAPAAPTAANHTRATQQMLKNQGYNIGVDGISGPQTSAAITAFHNHVPPAVFNKTGGKVVSPGAAIRTPTGATTAKTPPRGNSAAKGSQTFKPAPVASQTPSASTGGFDPAAYAQSAANAQYDPAISSLQGQLSNLQNEQPNIAKAIQDMYANANQQYQNLLSGEQTAGQGGQTDLSNTFGQAGQLFGQSNQGAMQTPQGIAQGELAGVNQSEQDYLQNMQPIMKASGASQVNNANSQYQAQINSLLSQLTQQQQAKGNAYTTDFQQGLSNAMQMQQNQQSTDIANALLPYQLQSAKAQASVDKSNAAYAPTINQGKVNLQSAQTNEANVRASKLIPAQVSEAMARAKKDLATGGANKNLLPGSSARLKLTQTLNQALLTTDPTTGAATKLPAPQASQALFQVAVQQGLMNSSGKELIPGFAEILKTTLQTAYPGYKWPWLTK